MYTTFSEDLGSSQGPLCHFQDGVIVRHSPSIWNLPASNAKCLEVFLYLKMASIPFDARESSYTYSHRGPLPHLQWFAEVHDSGTSIEYLKSKSNLDLELTKKEKILTNALSSLVQQKLHLANLFIMFADEENYTNVYRELGSHISWFLRSYYMRGEKHRYLEYLRLHNISSKQQVKILLRDALTTISEQLADQKYLLAKAQLVNQSEVFVPTSLDAIVGANLLLLFRNNFENLDTYLELCPAEHIENLKEYTIQMEKIILNEAECLNDVSEIWIPPSIVCTDEKETQIVEEEQQKDEEDEDERRKSLLFALGSIAGIVLFVGMNGNSLGSWEHLDEDDEWVQA